MSTVQYVSAERLELLKQELLELKTVKRREAADRIEEAEASWRSFGKRGIP